MKEKTEEKAEAPKSTLGRLLSSDKAVAVIVLVGLLGIVLIFISGSIHPDDAANGEVSTDESSIEQELINYRDQISEELGNMLASMDGVGRTKVMVTMDGSVQNVYATDVDVNGRETSRKNGSDENADKQNTEKKSCIVIRRKDGSEEALTIGKRMPQIKGVLVVCDGGDDEMVCENVIRAVAAALDIRESRICVSKLSAS